MLFNTATRVGTALLYHHASTNHMLKPNEHTHNRCWFIHCTVVPMACLVYSPAVGHVGWKAIHLLISGPQMLSCRLRDLIPASDLAVYANAQLIWCLSELHPTDCVQWPCWTSTQSFPMTNRYAHSRDVGKSFNRCNMLQWLFLSVRTIPHLLWTSLGVPMRPLISAVDMVENLLHNTVVLLGSAWYRCHGRGWEPRSQPARWQTKYWRQKHVSSCCCSAGASARL